ncbi:DUF4347 domain-containing protein [Marinobacter similis]|uniref:DUF4347 domain-containing protein n=1 Tax=Marinobacter similis TaxID=1420916 RepID=W5YU29_9GAMM|nr:DUF4347 domain-containing protein [Marinobacter similis]AHI29968.1 hypothetical protein AU14_02850 [Marinobacter similis]
MDKKQKRRVAPTIEALEPRVLFSADLFGGAADNPATDDSLATLLDDTAAVLEKHRAQLESEQSHIAPSEPPTQEGESTSPVAESAIRTELVFVDTDTPNYQQLVDDILSEGNDNRSLEVILLDNNRDGIEQITAALQNYQAVDAIHLISHGSDGNVDLGNTQLNNENLFLYQNQLQSWAEYLDPDADILFYGCDLAETEVGRSLIDGLAALTLADVAASDDLTGHESIGGDWDLEYETGDIETIVAISERQQGQWHNILANASPVLAGANDLTSINEDPVSNDGTLVSALIAGQVTDTDSGSLEGIAVTAVGDTNGTWQYTTDGGTNWFAFGAVDSSNARLLAADANTSVRFMPDANWNGTVTNGISFHAWDQTNGTAGGTADLSASATVRDEFTLVGWGNDDGSATWSGAWVENEAGGLGADKGNLQVRGGQLIVNAAVIGDNIYREVDISSATSATLTYAYDSSSMAKGEVLLQVSGDGGISFTTLHTFSSVNSGIGTGSFDISSYIATDTQIRLYVNDGAASNRTLYLDDIQIEYGSAGVGGSTAYSADPASSSVTVNAYNDAPVVTAPGSSLAATEQTSLSIEGTGFSVSDVDEAGAGPRLP